VWGVQVPSVARSQGLPCAGHSWSQLAPIAPPQDMSEPLSQAGSTSGKTYSKKGQKLCIELSEVRKKSVRKNPANSKVRGGGGEAAGVEGQVSSTLAMASCQPPTQLLTHSLSSAGQGGKSDDKALGER